MPLECEVTWTDLILPAEDYMARTPLIPSDEPFQADAPVALPDLDEHAEIGECLREIITDRWELRHLKWFRPQMRALMARYREVR